MKLKSTLIKSGIRYSLSSTLCSVVSMIVGFLNMRWLGPEVLGLWQSITIINSYLPFLQLGVQSGLNMDLPILLGKEKIEEARHAVQTGLMFAVFLSIFILIVGSFTVLIMAFCNCSRDVCMGVGAIVLIAVIQCYRLHYIATYRSADAFDKLSNIYFISAIVSAFLAFFIYKFGYFGLLVYSVGVQLITTLLMFVFAPYRGLKPSLFKYWLRSFLKRGVFVTFITQVQGVIDSIPRVLLLRLGGALQVGLFAPALSLGSLFNLIPNQLAQFLQPQMGFKYGKTGKAKDMWEYLYKISFIIPLFIIPISVTCWFVMPWVLGTLFPKYIESLMPIRIMLIGFVFSSSYISRSFLLTIKAYKEVGTLYIIDLICFVTFPIVLIKTLSYSLTVSLSIGLSIAYFITYITTFFVIRNTVFKLKYNQGAGIE